MGKPKCVGCGSADCHVTQIEPGNPNRGNTWMCGSCDFKRDHPDAAPYVPLPYERRAARLQKERLFDLPPPVKS